MALKVTKKPARQGTSRLTLSLKVYRRSVTSMILEDTMPFSAIRCTPAPKLGESRCNRCRTRLKITAEYDCDQQQSPITSTTEPQSSLATYDELLRYNEIADNGTAAAPALSAPLPRRKTNHSPLTPRGDDERLGRRWTGSRTAAAADSAIDNGSAAEQRFSHHR